MGVIGGYEDLRGEGAVGAPVMDALREPTRCAAVVVCWCVCACVSCGVILSGRAEWSGVRRLERESGREVEASAVGDTGGLNNQA